MALYIIGVTGSCKILPLRNSTKMIPVLEHKARQIKCRVSLSDLFSYKQLDDKYNDTIVLIVPTLG